MKAILITATTLLIWYPVFAQDDLMAMMQSTDTEPTEVSSTFKAIRLVNGHTTRTLSARTLDAVINHRFGSVEGGVDEFWGLDDAQIRLGLEYGATDRLTIGAARSSFENVVDTYLKYKLLAQKTSGTPITITAFVSSAIKTGSEAFLDQDYEYSLTQRLHYTSQLLISHKVDSKLSLQIMPSWVHSNLVQNAQEPNDILATGVGGRYKLTPRVSFNAEYYPTLNSDDRYTDSFAFGFDIETGGHVFQLHLTNSRAMIEEGFIASNTGAWNDGDIHFGFNISRSFDLSRKK